MFGVCPPAQTVCAMGNLRTFTCCSFHPLLKSYPKDTLFKSWALIYSGKGLCSSALVICLSKVALVLKISNLLSLDTEGNGTNLRRKLMAPDISLTLDPSGESVLSDDLDESGEIDLDDLDTPSENSNEFEWEGEYFGPFV